jgi:hypothetical protein
MMGILAMKAFSIGGYPTMPRLNWRGKRLLSTVQGGLRKALSKPLRWLPEFPHECQAHF